MSVKEPVQDQEALLKILKVMGAMSAAADTHKNVLFSGKKGREKYKDTKFNDADSILENAVEGTDVMENLGMEPGAASTYAAGTAYDIFNPVNLAISAATKIGGGAGKLAKLLSAAETVSEEAGKKVVKKALPKYLKQEMRHLKDLPKAERMAEEAIETGVSKKLSNPEKALDVLRGEKKLEKVGGTKALPISELKKKQGTLDKIGQELESTVVKEGQAGKKANKANIYRKRMDDVRETNAKGVKYKIDENSQDKILRDAISPFEVKTKRIVHPPDIKMKDATIDDLEQEVAKLEELVMKKKGESPPPIPSDEPPEIPSMDVPPPVPGEHDDMGLEDVLATLSDKRAAKSKVEAKNAIIDAKNKSAKPKIQDIQYEADVEVPLDDLWRKKVELRKQFKENTLGKPMSEWSEKDKTLEKVIDDIDEELIRRMSPESADAYRGLNEKYSNQSKLAQIFEDQLQSKQGSTAANAARGGAEIAAGGGMNPGTVGRTTKGIVNALTGPKRRVQFGNLMQDRRATTPLAELMSEITEVPFDPPYLKDESDHAADAEVDVSGLGGGWQIDDSGRSPQSVEEIPEAETATDIMAPDDAPVDVSGVGEGWEVDEPGRSPGSVEHIPGSKEATDIMAPKDELEQKMDETLSPEKPLFDPYVNEEILNTVLPRDSKRILANPTALMAKLQQVAPSQVPVLKDMLEHDPESLAEAGPILAMKFPAVFEKDDYGSFDGKILDPRMQEKFLNDLYHDEGLDAIAKANMAMKVKRGDSVL